MNSGDEAKAWENFRKAEKKINSFTLFSNKYENALEYYEKAAFLFKSAGLFTEASESFLKLADCHDKLSQQQDAANARVEASFCLKRFDIDKAVEVLSEACSTFISLGRIPLAAKHQFELAELLESDHEYDRAIEVYSRSASLYEMAEQQITANKAKLKIAHVSAVIGQYRKSSDTFEELAWINLDGPGRFSVRDYLFRAGIVHFAMAAAGMQDVQNVRLSLEEYDAKDPTFADAREYELLTSILRAFEAYSVEEFERAVQKFDNISRLDTWTTDLLLVIKEAIENGPSLT